ncbi:High-osmolarity-induced transcription protein 1 [Purpureocillium lavendulum]|uniref:High-osmolarity-induced transcription protein 1 n=1 Tax=Purpureocillium lavendulum TaxID=1247861 RepID=A0AB34FFD6_9HYPO|nr:High-osmolarity-induced transcription protein 1 [Purpureocillium lavendulum]
MDWQPRTASNVSVKGVNVTHNRWYKSETAVLSSIIGTSGFYTNSQVVDPLRTISSGISDVHCEGQCPAVLRTSPLRSYGF